MVIQKFIDTVYRFLMHREVYHTIFWCVLFGILMFLGRDANIQFEHQFRNEFLTLLFFMSAVYLNIRFLIPKYLARNPLFYLFSAIVLAALVTPIKIFVLYMLFAKNTFYRDILVSNQLPLYFGMLFVIFLSTVLKVLTDWWRYQQEKMSLVTQSMQSELRFLRSQINPHFLFNTLNNLYSLTLTKNDKAPEVVLKLAEIMRYMLYESNERRVGLHKEVEFIENYLALEQIRLPKDAEVRFEVEGEVKNHLIVPLLFVPFIENSFKHGLNRHLDTAGFVHIRLKIQADHLTFYIQNSKPHNLPECMRPYQGGIGLQNLTSRLKMNYPFRHTLKLEEADTTFTANMTLELNGYYAG
jgi:two-component system, LytTR family, sensor kinase